MESNCPRCGLDLAGSEKSCPECHFDITAHVSPSSSRLPSPAAPIDTSNNKQPSLSSTKGIWLFVKRTFITLWMVASVWFLWSINERLERINRLEQEILESFDMNQGRTNANGRKITGAMMIRKIDSTLESMDSSLDRIELIVDTIKTDGHPVTIERSN